MEVNVPKENEEARENQYEQWKKHPNYEVAAAMVINCNTKYRGVVNEMIPVTNDWSDPEDKQRPGYLATTFHKLTSAVKNQTNVELQLARLTPEGLKAGELVSQLKSSLDVKIGLCECAFAQLNEKTDDESTTLLKTRLADFFNEFFKFMCFKENILVPLLLKIDSL